MNANLDHTPEATGDPKGTPQPECSDDTATQSSSFVMVVGVLALGILVPVLVVVAVLIGARAPDGDHSADHSRMSHPTVAAANQPQHTATTDTASMIELHQGMLDQMRVSVSSQMTQLMNDDPMWQMMHSSGYLAELEQHAEDIDRMLARGG